MAPIPCALATGKRRASPSTSESSKPQNVDHIICARRLVLPPERGLERATGENRPISGYMAQNNPLTGSGEDHVMLAHDIAPTDGGEADIATLSGTGDPVAPTIGHFVKRHAAPFGGGFAEHQGCARRRIDLLVVMRLDDLDIEIRIERGGDLLGQLGQKVDPERHIPGADDYRMAGGRVNSGKVGSAEASRADHMDGAGLRRESRKFDGRGRRGKINDSLRLGEGFDGIIGDDHAKRRAAHRLAHIAPDPSVAFALDRADQMAGPRLTDRADQHLSHAPRGACNHDSRCLRHDRSPQFSASPCLHSKASLGKGAEPAYVQRMAKNRFSTGSGPSQRQLRVGEVLRRALSDVLTRGDIHDPDLARMSITVGEVRCSPDLKQATAYVLPLGGQGKDEALAALRRNKAEIRHLVTKGITLKFAPDLRFEIDETFDRMDETRRLFADEHVRQDLDD
jgi:ribosome-binding factor A